MAKRGAGLLKKMPLSDDLADFMGKETATRAEVMKKIWAHIKKHELQDEKNKRLIHPDDDIAPIIGAKAIDMFKMTKKLNEHIG